MRITGGRARGIRLDTPSGKGTRPATDRIREAVFSSLGECVHNAAVVDLFAGTGAYGLEALSRGAVSAAFYETGREALACLRRNIRSVLHSCGLNASAAQVLATDAFAASPPLEQRFDLIFADPPYALAGTHMEKLFATVTPLAASGTRFILELPGDAETTSSDWSLVRRLGKPGRDRPSAAIYIRG